MFCDGFVETFVSIYKTLLAFVGGLTTDPYLPIIGSHVPEYMEKENWTFLSESMGYSMVKRSVNEVEIDESLI